VGKQLGKLRGVHDATVNYAAGNVTVRYDEALITITATSEPQCISAVPLCRQLAFRAWERT
jgi:copper chaperone CopZ